MRYREGKTAIILDHVNNFERHGLPDDEREWSLTDKMKQKPQYDDSGELKIRQCMSCYATFKANRICPYCGEEAQLSQREIKNIKQIELQEIKEKREEKAKGVVIDYRSPEECRNMEELKQYARNMKYKPGWIFFQAKLRGWMK